MCEPEFVSDGDLLLSDGEFDLNDIAAVEEVAHQQEPELSSDEQESSSSTTTTSSITTTTITRLTTSNVDGIFVNSYRLKPDTQPAAQPDSATRSPTITLPGITVISRAKGGRPKSMRVTPPCPPPKLLPAPASPSPIYIQSMKNNNSNHHHNNNNNNRNSKSQSMNVVPPKVLASGKWELSKVHGTDSTGKRITLRLWKAPGPVGIDTSTDCALISTRSPEPTPPRPSNCPSTPSVLISPVQSSSALYTGDLDLDSMCVVGGSTMTTGGTRPSHSPNPLSSPPQQQPTSSVYLGEPEEDSSCLYEETDDASVCSGQSSSTTTTPTKNSVSLSDSVSPSSTGGTRGKGDNNSKSRGRPPAIQKTIVRVTTRSGLNLDLSEPDQLVAYSRISHTVKVKDKDVPCPSKGCNKMFASIGAMRKHLHWHSSGTHACPECGRTFVERSKLKRHQKVHTGERAYVCSFPDCGKRFTHECNLKTHVRTHTGDKPYVCPVQYCTQSFAQSSNLVSHIKTHEVCKRKSGKRQQQSTSTSRLTTTTTSTATTTTTTTSSAASGKHSTDLVSHYTN